jgi:hypothetical protein
LNRLGLQRDVIEMAKSAGMGDFIFAPQPAHHLHQLFAHFDPRARGKTQDAELVFLGRLLRPSITDAQVDAAARQPVETGELVRKQNGMPQCRQKNRRAQADPTRSRAYGRESRQCIDARSRR